MGSGKGQSQTSQTSTYTPNAQAQAYIGDALGRAQQAANSPFSIPQAPVAGFSGQQQQAFDQIGQSYNQAQPYFQQAQSFYNQSATPDINSFYNPMAQNVTNQLQNIFGQQNVQNTGDLVHSAGGVGADRIAVGQANMANQQGLAAGQTYANLYQQAVQAAQQQQQNLRASGAGMASLGQTAQNASLQGAGALLSAGGLQQQLQQAQLNSPYQQQIARAAFPYQQAQFYGNMVGALAPGLGGTTGAAGTATPAQPSMWSQLLGAGTAGVGALGGMGAFGGQGWLTGSSPSYGGGNFFSGDAYGGSASNPTAGLSASDYGPMSRGGVAGYDEGGGVSDKPIDISSNPFIPQTQMHAIQPHIPQLQQQQQQGGSGGGIGDILKTGAQLAMMFANRGGSVPGYDEGGFVDMFGDDKRNVGRDLLRAELGVRAPDSIPGGEPAPEPYRMADPAAVDAWRGGVDRDIAAGNTAQGSEAPVMTAAAHRPGRMTASAAPPASAMAFAGSPDASSDLPPEISGGNSYAAQRGPAGGGAPSGGGADNPFIPMTPGGKEHQDSFANSPWAALMQAGLGMMGGTSPFAGVNIGQGGQQGLKVLEQQREASQKEETIAQAAKRLALEAKFHEDQYTRQKPQFGWEVKKDGSVEPTKGGPNDPEYLGKVAETSRREKYGAAGSLVTKDGAVHPLVLEATTGKVIDAVTGQPPVDTDKIDPKGAPKQRTTSLADEDAQAIARYTVATGDDSRVRSLGFNPENKALVQKMINQEMAAQKVDDKEMAARKQEFSANGISKNAGARVRATREENLNLILKATTAAIPAALEESDKVQRYTGYVPLDRIIQKGQLITNDANLVTFGMANLQLAEHWARAMNPTGVMRESDRDLALHFLDTAFSSGTYKKAVMQLQKQVERERDATREGKSTIPPGGVVEPGQEPRKTESAAPAAAPARGAQDQQALDWANANPNDPRAAAIKQRLGVQ